MINIEEEYLGLLSGVLHGGQEGNLYFCCSFCLFVKAPMA